MSLQVTDISIWTSDPGYQQCLAYWLSHASKLFLLLKASGSYGMAPQCHCSSSAALFGRMTQVNIASVLNRLIPIEKLSFFR